MAFGLVLAAFAAFQQFKLPPVLPVMLEDYGYDRVLAGGFMGIYALMGLLLSLPLSRLIGRAGPLRPVWGALLLFLAGNFLTLALPEAGWVVLLARALEGLAFTVLALVGPASANANADRRHLPLVFALTASWIPAGQIAAALVALPTQDAGLWRPVWWVCMAATLAMALWLVALQRGRGLYLGGGQQPGKAPRPLTAEERLLLWGSGAAFLIFSGQYIAYMTWFPAYMVEALAFTPADAIFVYLVPVAMTAVFNVVAALLMRRGLPPAGLLVIGFALEVVGWVFLPEAEGLLLGLLLLAYGAGGGLVPAGLFAMPTTIVGAGGPTIPAFAILMTLRNLGVLIGPLALPVLIGPQSGWGLAAPVFAAVCLLALLLCLLLARRLKRRPPLLPGGA